MESAKAAQRTCARMARAARTVVVAAVFGSGVSCTSKAPVQGEGESVASETEPLVVTGGRPLNVSTPPAVSVASNDDGTFSVFGLNSSFQPFYMRQGSNGSYTQKSLPSNTAAGPPSVAKFGTKLYVVVPDDTGRVWRIEQSAASSDSWNPWSFAPTDPMNGIGIAASSLLLVNDTNGTGRLENFMVDVNGTLSYAVLTPGGSWSGWTALGGVGAPPKGVRSNLAVARAGDNSPNVFFRAGSNTLNLADNTLSQLRTNIVGSNITTAFKTIGGSPNFIGDPAVVRDATARMNVFVLGGDFTMTMWCENAASQVGVVQTWTANQWLAGASISSPVPAVDGTGKMHVFSVAPTRRLQYRRHNGVWENWQDLGSPGATNKLTSAPAVGLNSSGRLEVFARMDDGAVWRVVQTSTGWSTSWSTLGGVWKLPTDPSATPAKVTTQHNDNDRTGAQLSETTLSTQNVNPGQFGKLFSFPVNGNVYAQPLYVPSIAIQGKTRNVLVVATLNNHVYTFDADGDYGVRGDTPLWHIGNEALGPPVPSPQPDFGVVDTPEAAGPSPCAMGTIPNIGIVSTPVVDTASNTLYVTSFTAVDDFGGFAALPRCDFERNPYPSNRENCHTYLVVTSTHCTPPPPHHYRWLLHAINLITGTEKPGSPTIVSLPPSTPAFVPEYNMQRPGLLFSQSKVYLGFGSHNDAGGFHGWVIGYTYNGSSFTRLSTGFISTPTVSGDRTSEAAQNGGGIWQSGQGLTADASGNIYFVTGNGPTATGASHTVLSNYGDTMVKLNAQLNVADWFAPAINRVVISGTVHDLQMEQDNDMGSGGVLRIPSTGQLLGGGKRGILHLVDPSNPASSPTPMGRLRAVDAGPANANAQDLVATFVGGGCDEYGFPSPKSNIHGSPVYWDDNKAGAFIYVNGEGDYLRAFRFGATTPTLFTDTSLSPANCGCHGGTFGGAVPTYPCLVAKAVSPGQLTFAMPGGMLSISANKRQGGTGIVWDSHTINGADADATYNTRPGVLEAFDAGDVGKILWTSEVNHARDSLGNFAKFTMPTIANGKVFVATFSDQVVAYGLLNPECSKDADCGKFASLCLEEACVCKPLPPGQTQPSCAEGPVSCFPPDDPCAGRVARCVASKCVVQ